MDYSTHMVYATNDSYNEISSSYLGLKSNHLSGHLAPFMQYCIVDINVLDGNMFMCNIDNLPKDDPYYTSYYCGSNYLLGMWYALFVVVFLSFLLTVVVGLYLRCSDWIHNYARNKSYLDKLLDYNYTCFSFLGFSIKYVTGGILNTVHRVWVKLFMFPPASSGAENSSNKYSTNKIHKDVVDVLHLFVCIRRFSLALVLFACILLLPTYTIMRKRASTYMYTYGWSVSIAYMDGSQISAIIFGIWMLLLVFCTVISIIMEKHRIDDNNDSLNHTSSNKSAVSSATQKKYSRSKMLYYYLVKFYLLGFILVDFIVMVIANALYIYITITQSPLYAAICKFIRCMITILVSM